MERSAEFKILIVDDNPVNLKLMEVALINEGYLVIKAADGPMARRKAFDGQPDLILLDILMPGEDGFETMSGLKKNSNTAHMPVIFLTGKDSIKDKMKGFNLGAVDYITKPFHIPEVLARVGLHLKLSLATNKMIAFQAEKLKQVKDAQAAMLVSPEDLPEAGFSVFYKSLMEAGGDLYDVIKISEDIYGYCVADVSGHDLSTSFITAALKALMQQNCTPFFKPVESMSMINKVLVDVLPTGKYLTACYAKLNRRSKSLTVISAGHPPLIFIPKNGEAVPVELEGDVLGIFKNVAFESREFKVKKGDRFFLYTDGLVERPEDSSVWTNGIKDLVKACGYIKNMPLQEAVGKLKVLMLGEDYMPEDDIVILGVDV